MGLTGGSNGWPSRSSGPVHLLMFLSLTTCHMGIALQRRLTSSATVEDHARLGGLDSPVSCTTGSSAGGGDGGRTKESNFNCTFFLGCLLSD